MLDRWIENGLLDVLDSEGIGCIAFCPLAQGLLTDKYLKGIPQDSRAAKPYGYLKAEQVNQDVLKKTASLRKIAVGREQSLGQMALAWVLRDNRVTSALIGASRVEQIEDNIAALKNLQFTPEELAEIDTVLK
jgi:L-glyceraldehyde 3-phosphate reductase